MKPMLVLAAAGALALGGCGGGSSSSSNQDDAKAQVCDARADISKQVDTLKGLTISTATVDQVQKSLQAIMDDLSQIAKAQGDLAGDRKDEVQQANKAFANQVQDIVANLGKSLSLSNAGTQLQSGLQQLAGAYEDTFAKVDCGS